jgi:NO-binding membrane sensor protein with MHYT domain
MGAIRGCGLDYDPLLVAASVAIAIGASMAALWFAFYK